jgi:DNA-binding transcriptional regulator YiaG
MTAMKSNMNHRLNHWQTLANTGRRALFARNQLLPTEALQARARMDLSQSQFAKLLGVSVRTLQEWEQGRKKPTGAARTLLRVAVQTPQALLSLAKWVSVASCTIHVTHHLLLIQ